MILRVAEYGRIEEREFPPRVFERLREFDLLMARRCRRDPVFDWTRRGCAVARNLVGVLRVPGATVEILPKTAEGGGVDGVPEHAQANLLTMLSMAGELPLTLRGMAPLSLERLPLFDAFVEAFCAGLLAEVSRGPDRGYSYREDLLRHVRGRLLLPAILRQNPAEKHRVPVGYDEFDEDTALNRILRAAARRLLETRGATAARASLTRVLEEFGEVADEEIREPHFRRVAFHRNNERFRDLFRFARIVLLEQSPAPRAGAEETFSLVFPMDRLFESFFARYVAANARRLGLEPARIHVQARGRSEWLLTRIPDGRPAFLLRPDLVIEAHGEFPGAVLDTKWKLPPRDGDAGSVGASPSDIYQMTAYAHRFGMRENILVYPALEGCREETFSVEGTEARLSLRMLRLDHDLRREPGRTLDAFRAVLGLPTSAALEAVGP